MNRIVVSLLRSQERPNTDVSHVTWNRTLQRQPNFSFRFTDHLPIIRCDTEICALLIAERLWHFPCALGDHDSIAGVRSGFC